MQIRARLQHRFPRSEPKSRPAVEALVFLTAKLVDVSTGLLSSKIVTTELQRKAQELRQAGGDILKLAVQQAQTYRTVSRST
jgi:hypothetical protein